MIEKIVVPDIGENVVSGKVVAVHVKAGDMVDVDDTVIELETDKAVVEIPSTAKGKVTEVLASDGDELKVGDIIAKVETEAKAESRSGQPSDSDEADKETGPDKAGDQEKDDAPGDEETRNQGTSDSNGEAPDSRQVKDDSPAPEPTGRPVPASPSLRRMARELGVAIETIEGSGPGGRITEEDIKAKVRKDRQGADTGAASSGAVGSEPQLPDFSRWGDIEDQELETVRRLTAESTWTSWLTIPHVTQFDKADITQLENFLESNAGKVEQAGGKLTLTPVLTKVCAQALKKFPRFNTSLDLTRRRLIFKHYVHIGIAVDTPRGLLMPVIRDADAKSITELAVEIVDLARRARSKKVKSEEMEGGTFSISNQGGIGGVGFTPVILWPQVAILGISRAAIEPLYVDEAFQPRRMLPLTLSYDHRVIDGADAARFLRWICQCLEQPMTMQL